MKPPLLLMTIALISVACTDTTIPDPPSAEVSPSETVSERTRAEIEIYTAVIRQLSSEKDLRRRAEVIYVVDGGIVGAGKPRGNPFGPPPQGFGDDVVAGIRQQVADELPPLRFVDDGRNALRRPDRPGLVKSGGVLISLGPIDTASVASRSRTRCGAEGSAVNGRPTSS